MFGKTKKQWVIQIVGTSYSGSSLLNLLLDSQPEIRGLGEACHIYDHPGRLIECTTCRTALENCPFFKKIDRTNIYKDCLRKYQCRIVVDSSKKVKMRSVLNPDLQTLVVFLSKSPHEFAHSYIRHNEGSDVKKAFEEYVYHYNILLRDFSHRALDELNISHKIMVVTYRELALHPSNIIQRICALCDEPFLADAYEKWNETDSHIVGGNGAVSRQVGDRKSFFETDPKYKGKKGKIFVDDYWRGDNAFIEECRSAYRDFQKDLDAILPLLHQPPTKELSEELSLKLVAA